MSKQPDDLFRSTLKDYSPIPPSAAWSRIHNRMSARNTRRKWSRITAVAASLLLLFTILQLLIEPATVNEISSAQYESENPPAKTEQAESNESTTAILQEDESVKPEPVQEVKKAVSEVSATSTATTDPSENNLSVEKHEEANDVQVQTIEPPTTLATNTDEFLDDSMKFTMDLTKSDQYRLKKNDNHDATDEIEKSSGIKKLITLASEIRQENPFADLRQKKDELLATNKRHYSQTK